MPAMEAEGLWKALDVLEAQEHLSLTRALSYTSLTKQARSERDKALYSTAYPRSIYKREAKDVGALLHKLGGKDERRK